MNFGIAGVAGITVICYLIGQIGQAAGLSDRWLPCLLGLAGAALGAAGLYLMPDFPATEPLTAVAVGIVSGLAANGARPAEKREEKSK